MTANWLIGVLAVLVLIGAVFFGGIGGMTFMVMIVILAIGILAFRNRVRSRRHSGAP